ncbi:hypothetical protein [Streptomyces stelliscabiei]
MPNEGAYRGRWRGTRMVLAIGPDLVIGCELAAGRPLYDLHLPA